MIPRSTSTRRRAAGTVAAALALVAGLAACSSGGGAAPAATGGGTTAPADSGPVTLQMTIWGGANDKSVMEERLALAKTALPNITVKLNQIADAYDTKMQTMFAGNTAPDIMQVAESVNVYSSKGQLLDLSSALPDAVKEFGQGAVNTYSTDGKLWAAPDRVGAMVLYYNKDLFDAAGVAYPDGSWTWNDFRDAAKKLTVKDASGATTQWGYGAGDWWPWYMSWMYQNGGRVLDDSGKPVANSPENVEALSFYNSMVFDDGSALSPEAYANLGLKNGQPDPLFAQGKLAMNATGFWNISSLKDATMKWGIAPLPKGKVAAVPAFGSGLAVTAKSAHQAAATELVTFLTSTQGQTPIATSGLDVPANIEAIGSDAFQKPVWNKSGVDLSAFTDSAASVFAPPLVPQWNEIQKAFTDGMADTWNNKESVQAGLDKVQANLKQIFK